MHDTPNLRNQSPPFALSRSKLVGQLVGLWQDKKYMLLKNIQ